MMLVLLVQGSHFEEQKEQELANLFYKVQIVNILAFVSVQSVATTQLCHCNAKAARDNM